MAQLTTWINTRIDRILFTESNPTGRSIAAVINLTAAIFSVMYLVLMLLRDSPQRAFLAATVGVASTIAYLLTKTRYKILGHYIPPYATTIAILAAIAIFKVDQEYPLLLMPVALSFFLLGIGQTILLMIVHLIFIGITYQLGYVQISILNFHNQQVVYVVLCLIFLVVTLFQQARIRYIRKQAQELVTAEHEKQTLHLQKQRNQIITQLVTDISHDFRTPLSVINTNVYFIDKTNEIDKRRQVQCRILDATSKIDQILDEMLVLMQLSQDKTSQFSNSNLTHVLRAVTEKLDPEHKRVKLEITEESPMLAIDNEELQLLLFKLMDNALKFSPTDTPVNIKVNKSVNRLEIQIKDDGYGIAPENIDRIFDPFYKIDESRNTAQNSGSGLGLAIAQAIAHSNGGEIKVSSEVSQGSTFSLILPKYAPVATVD